MKTIALSGIAEFKADYPFSNYYLVQPDGYRIDLISRVAEIAAWMGGRLSATWWISDTPKTRDELVEGFLARVYGDVKAARETETVHYSTLTGTCDYHTTECMIGGHSLLDPITDNEGKFILFEFTEVEPK